LPRLFSNELHAVLLFLIIAQGGEIIPTPWKAKNIMNSKDIESTLAVFLDGFS